jgi:hypothetical protein
MGNIINALRDNDEGPTGPAQATANILAPGNAILNNVGKGVDLIANFAFLNAYGEMGAAESATGLWTASQYDFATLEFAESWAKFFETIGQMDYGAQVIDAWNGAFKEGLKAYFGLEELDDSGCP